MNNLEIYTNNLNWCYSITQIVYTNIQAIKDIYKTLAEGYTPPVGEFPSYFKVIEEDGFTTINLVTPQTADSIQKLKFAKINGQAIVGSNIHDITIEGSSGPIVMLPPDASTTGTLATQDLNLLLSSRTHSKLIKGNNTYTFQSETTINLIYISITQTSASVITYLITINKTTGEWNYSYNQIAPVTYIVNLGDTESLSGTIDELDVQYLRSANRNFVTYVTLGHRRYTCQGLLTSVLYYSNIEGSENSTILNTIVINDNTLTWNLYKTKINNTNTPTAVTNLDVTQPAASDQSYSIMFDSFNVANLANININLHNDKNQLNITFNVINNIGNTEAWTPVIIDSTLYFTRIKVNLNASSLQRITLSLIDLNGKNVTYEHTSYLDDYTKNISIWGV